jgi:hypothetical protein
MDQDEVTTEERQKLEKFVDDNYEVLKKALADPDYTQKVIDILRKDRK